MRRDSVIMSFFEMLPRIISITTLIGCVFCTLFNVVACIGSPVVKESGHRLKTEGPTSAREYLTKTGSTSFNFNHYEVLDIPWFSPVETVKKAYHEKVMIYHPDKFGGDEEEANMNIQQAREAYETLTSKERCMYDFNLGSGIRRFADCNQAWLDKETEMFNERLKEVRKEKREAQEKH